MNADEHRLLTGFLTQLKEIRGVQKDQDAESLIHKAAVEQPDALYLLVQKALIQDQALAGARQQIAVLERQLEESRISQTGAASGGFLSQNPWAGGAVRQGPGGAAPAPQSPAYAPNPTPQAPMSSGFGSFLGSAAATAAGVAGGAFLFHGIESMIGHHGGGYGYSDTGYGEGHHPENVTINEYYGDSQVPPTHEAGFSPMQNDDLGQVDDWDSYDDDVNSVDV